MRVASPLRAVRKVVFVEVKTGRAGLVSRERLWRDAFEAGRVEYQLMRLEDASALADLEGAKTVSDDV